jgi:thiol-disulfide isomerase/thioredoxin
MDSSTSLTPVQLQQIQTALKPNEVIIIKFSAVWCGPCKVIKPVCEEWKKTMPATMYWVDIDIDESIELYMAFKSKRMISGVPTLFAFRGDKKRDQWYIPDDSVSGGNVKAVADFLKRCLL